MSLDSSQITLKPYVEEVLVAKRGEAEDDYCLVSKLGCARLNIMWGTIDQIKAYVDDFYGPGIWEDNGDITDILIYRRQNDGN